MRRLPGTDGARAVTGAEGGPGSLTVRIAATAHAESAMIADALRRTHLIDGVPWSQMAVIVRSVPRLGAPLARVLVSAGVPVDSPAPSVPLADQAAVRALLTVLDVTAHGLDGDRALSLLTGPDRSGRPGVAASTATGVASRRWPQPPREFTDLLTEALDNETDQPLSRSGPPIAAGACGARGRAPQRRRRTRPALHAVAGLASVRPAAALAGGQRARRPRRRCRPTATSTR
jgi:hypothetical protein